MANEFWLPSLFGTGDPQRDPFRALQKRIDDVFAELGGGAGSVSAMAGGFAPRCDVSETDSEIRITAELPGVEEKDVEVVLNADRLTIKGEKRSETKEDKDEEGRQFHRVERSYGSFMRTMAVPPGVDPEKVKADFKSGVLTVTLEKPAALQAQARKIPIGG